MAFERRIKERIIKFTYRVFTVAVHLSIARCIPIEAVRLLCLHVLTAKVVMVSSESTSLSKV